MKDLRGKVALVTGAGSGIGKAIACALAAEGCHVVINDIRPDSLDSVEETIRSLGRRTVRAVGDVSQVEDVERICQIARNEFGQVDILINNAGVGLGGHIDSIKRSSWQNLFAINFWSQLDLVRALLPEMLDRGEGHLVHIASAGGLIATSMMMPYSVTKFAVVGLAESLACQLLSSGVGVSVVCPANVQSALHERADVQCRTDQEQSSALAALNRFNMHGIPTEKVAKRVVQAIKKKRFMVYTHWYVRPLLMLRLLFPNLTVRLNHWIENRVIAASASAQ